ncbi:hypothetical protein SBP02_05965 [Pseudomonas benzenivorans]|uniref:HicA toxin of toxin-antitoxin n=1 Tax=Pseudomonas benzenivorans TaxID=556533 RepID=A0ABZ0PYK7_9PSED|nr:hypothetical protein [Pseudomonas benzenivorans]WPC06297.1 hypothetical protein SBP02_05965 [Pseudomonas benzenivorans]
MAHKHQNLLYSIFEDPLRSNIHWREVESLLHHLEAKVEPILGARFRVTLNDYEFVLHHPHQGNECSKQEIKHLRECLANAGMTPSGYDQKFGRAG